MREKANIERGVVIDFQVETGNFMDTRGERKYVCLSLLIEVKKCVNYKYIIAACVGERLYMSDFCLVYVSLSLRTTANTLEHIVFT